MNTNVTPPKKGFIVLLVLASGSTQPVFRTDDILDVYDTDVEAVSEIQECVTDTEEAVKEGNMDEAYTMEDYQTGEVIVLNPDAEPANQIIAFNDEGEWKIMTRSEEDFSPVLVLSVSSSNGQLYMNLAGYVLEVEDESDDKCISNIIRFNIPEWEQFYKGTDLPGTFDILDLGYLYKDQEGKVHYEEPAYDYRRISQRSANVDSCSELYEVRLLIKNNVSDLNNIPIDHLLQLMDAAIAKHENLLTKVN